MEGIHVRVLNKGLSGISLFVMIFQLFKLCTYIGVLHTGAYGENATSNPVSEFHHLWSC